MIETWNDLKELANELLAIKNLSSEYSDRLLYEIEEIEKQAAGGYWLDLFNNKKRFEHNKSGLVIAWVLKLTKVDPIKNGIKHDVKYQADFPDVDMDVISASRDPIKKHIINKYGEDNVCSVGSWQYYAPKSAIQDILAAQQTDYEASIKKRHEVIDITSKLPDDFDKLTLEEAINPIDKDGKPRPQEFELFRNFYENNKEGIGLAYKAVGLIKNQGQHAAGVIISSKPIKDYIPLVFKKKKDEDKGQWISEWTEGENAQLSKFGFVKFDLLGLLTLSYIYDCIRNLKANKGIVVNLRDIDPEANKIGTITKDGETKNIPFDDEKALKLGDSASTESIFQFDTHFMTDIIRKCGIKSFNDIVIITSLGRPGPLPMLDVWRKRRDGEETWEDKTHPKLIDTLKNTFGVYTFQEQLSASFIEFCGLTAPEAEAVRKAVAKKHTEVFQSYFPRLLSGASRYLSTDEAQKLIDSWVSFGRYAFNKCLSNDTLIKTPSGNVQIKDLKVGDEVISTDNKPIVTTIKDIITRDDELFEFTMDDGSIIKCTMEHKFMCDDGKYYEIKDILRNNLNIKEV